MIWDKIKKLIFTKKNIKQKAPDHRQAALKNSYQNTPRQSFQEPATTATNIPKPDSSVCGYCGESTSKNVINKRGAVTTTGGLFKISQKSRITMAFKCGYCGDYFCEEHRLPEKHNCIGLKLRKQNRKTQNGIHT